MSQMIDAARSGMLQHERHVELIANNLANMNTPGYKRLAVHFSDLLTTEAALAVLADGEPVSTTSGVELDRTERIQEPGALVPSGDPLSMAIVGAGYFAVALADGTPAYTRDGSFSRDAEGFVTTPNGFRLQPPLQITGAVAELVIRSDGTVLVNRGGGSTAEEVGQLQLALFRDPGQLESAGQNVFLATLGSGAAQLATPGADGAGTVLTGVIESSNVDLATELTNLIAAQRAYQFNLVAFQTADEMAEQLNQATQV